MRCKNLYLFLMTFLFVGILVSCDNKKTTEGVQISNVHLLIRIDSLMQMQIENTMDGAQPLMDSFSTSEYLITKNFTAKEFLLKEKSKSTLNDHSGSGTIWTLKGTYPDYPLEKIVKIKTYADYPNAAYFKVRYVNKGDKSLTIKGWVNNHYSIIPSPQDSIPFYSFQGSSHEDRRDWIQKVKRGTYENNYMGMNDDDYGGGIPLLDIWRRDAGIAIGQSDQIIRLVSLPISYKENQSYAQIGVNYNFPVPMKLAPEDTLSTYETFVNVHQKDAFYSLRQFGKYMQTKGVVGPKPDSNAFEPIWCAWGYGRNFTPEEIIKTLPIVKKLGFKYVGIDDGYQQAIGDWHTNKETFPEGDKGMRNLVDSIHSYGLKATLWWAPMAASPESNFYKEHPHSFIKLKNGDYQHISWWDSYYLSPTNSIVRESAKDIVNMFIGNWDFDALKLDGQYMNACGMNHNVADNLDNPAASIERLPSYFNLIFSETRKIKPNAVVEFCPCGDVMNLYLMPFTNQFVASDPESAYQVRTKGLVYHAIMPQTAYFGDHVELINGDFATQIGVGAVPGSKFVWTDANTPRRKNLLLTPQKEKEYKKWLTIYEEKMLSKGTYLGGLYDIGYDYPETHVIKKNDIIYFAFYNSDFNGKIELRGLNSSEDYTVTDYYHNKDLGTINGKNPNIIVNFKDFLLLEVSPKS